MRDFTIAVYCEGKRIIFKDYTFNVHLGDEFWYSSIEDDEVKFNITLRRQNGGRYFAGIVNKGRRTLEIHVAIETQAFFGSNSYTLIPGTYYNGNNSEPAGPIPNMSAEEGWRFEVQASACSIPSVFNWDGEKEVKVLRGSPFTKAGSSGFLLDKERAYMAFVVPSLENKRYKHTAWVDLPRRGFLFEPGDCLTFCFEIGFEEVHSIRELFYIVNEHYRKVEGYADRASGSMKLEKASDLICDWIMKRHYVMGKRGEPIFLNAFYDYGGVVYGSENFPPEWCQITGWSLGSMLAYPLLKKGGKYREAALSNLEFLLSGGFWPCGLKMGVFDGTKWLDDCNSYSAWNYHPRPPAEFITWLLISAAYESSIGCRHPHWYFIAEKGLDAFCKLWEKYGDFGYHIDMSKAELELLIPGSCAGAFVLQALAQGLAHFPGNGRYEKVYREAAIYYHQNFVLKGHCTGGPLDIHMADDSESAAALTNAFVQGWKIFKEDIFLSMAEDAAQIFLSWVVSYDAPFPIESSLWKVNPCGGVLANVQNRHIGPGICTNSPYFLYEIYKATGKELYKNIYCDIIQAACNLVCEEDGKVLGFDGSFWYPFAAGMVCEQANLTDAVNVPGELFAISCSWPAVGLLMSWADNFGEQ